MEELYIPIYHDKYLHGTGSTRSTRLSTSISRRIFASALNFLRPLLNQSNKPSQEHQKALTCCCDLLQQFRSEYKRPPFSFMKLLDMPKEEQNAARAGRHFIDFPKLWLLLRRSLSSLCVAEETFRIGRFGRSCLG